MHYEISSRSEKGEKAIKNFLKNERGAKKIKENPLTITVPLIMPRYIKKKGKVEAMIMKQKGNALNGLYQVLLNKFALRKTKDYEADIHE